jgi:hypothetical protein
MSNSRFIEMYPETQGFYYEVDTGLPWTSRTSRNDYNSELKKINSLNSSGYYQISINGKTTRWHRLVWQHFNGAISKDLTVDHINNNRTDCRIENLQLLSQRVNSRKRCIRNNNTTGFAGVHWCNRENKYVARIGIDYKRKHLGYFDNPEEAYKAYLDAKVKYHGKPSIVPLTKEDNE